MKLIFSFCLLIVLGGTSGAPLAWAGDDFDEERATVSFEAIQHALNVLRTGKNSVTGCDFKDNHRCDFSSYCEAFRGRTDEIYLYQNDEGKKVANFALLTVFNSLDECMRQAEPQTINEDPFIYPEKLLEPQNKKLFEAEKKRSVKIYEETKSRLLKVLEARQQKATDKEAIGRMIERVRTVKMNFPDMSQWEDLYSAGCEGPNAFYAPDSHSFTLCPQILNFPEASLMSVIAHELAHSIDPCHAAQDLIKTEEGYVVDYALDFGGQKAIAPASSNPAVKGMGLSSNPLASVIRCLAGDTSIGAKIPTAKDMQNDLEKDILSLKKEEKLSESNRAIRELRRQQKQLPGLYDRYAGCEFLSGNGHIGEAFADWASAQVLADKVQDIPESAKARQFVQESQVLFLGTACKGLFRPLQDRVARLLQGNDGPVCGKAFFDYEAFENEASRSHPVSAERMTKIIYAQPELQKALGCRPGKAKACE